ncbi:DUF2232 domain-containing protein [Cohnella sp. REN36]|uniref:DUF2232 domain-containing protein n=1 Tax=Cohnella sp. REN36 TaxID=2887347 RepID=UPI001D13926D|nr:DUF2232 domain-containing protein [Cohnella sp. REN36]MCC3376806.1 YybS family protein [Cohnella sp. REN36]
MGWKSLAWSAAALVLLLSIATSLSGITLFLLMTPLVVLYTMLKPVSFAVHIVAIAAVAYLMLGSAGAIALTFGFFFLVPSIVMGHLYKRRAKAKTVVMVGFLVLLAQLLTELALFSAQYNIDFSAQLATFIEDWMKQMQANDLIAGDWATAATSIGDAIVRMLPTLLLLTSFLIAIVTHALSRRALAMSGIVAPALPEMKTWMLPRSLVFYYLIAVILSYAVPASSTGFWSAVASNAMPILQFAFTVQAMAFFFYLAGAKQWPKIIPIVLMIPVLLFPPFYLIGLLDVAFPLRKYFAKK